MSLEALAAEYYDSAAQLLTRIRELERGRPLQNTPERLRIDLRVATLRQLHSETLRTANYLARYYRKAGEDREPDRQHR